MRDLLRTTLRLAAFFALPVILVSVLPSTAHAFSVDATVSAEVPGMIDGYDNCSFADDPANRPVQWARFSTAYPVMHRHLQA